MVRCATGMVLARAQMKVTRCEKGVTSVGLGILQKESSCSHGPERTSKSAVACQMESQIVVVEVQASFAHKSSLYSLRAMWPEHAHAKRLIVGG
jgi:hypothetical protein